jgi:hypothetical protein
MHWLQKVLVSFFPRPSRSGGEGARGRGGRARVAVTAIAAFQRTLPELDCWLLAAGCCQVLAEKTERRGDTVRGKCASMRGTWTWLRKARSVLAARTKDPTKQESDWVGGNKVQFSGRPVRATRPSLFLRWLFWLASQMRWALYISKSGKRETLD